jgi:polyribonucleotide nucleotidyltransferase
VVSISIASTYIVRREGGIFPAAAPAAPTVPVAEKVSESITVESKKIGLLIGPKGLTKMGIQTATGTTITMPRNEKAAPAGRLSRSYSIFS